MIRFKALVIILTMAFISKAMAVTQTTVTAGNDPIVLENSRMALNIGSKNGAILSMNDKRLDIYYEFEGLAFEISTNKGILEGFGADPNDFRINVLSSISTTAYCQIGPGYRMLSREESRQFLNKWRSWATDNYKYLKVKRDLFDSPGLSPIDGSAHIIKDRGFIFLFSPEHEGKTVRASIPINRWIQLEENPDAIYQIKEVYPREGRVLATVRYGEDFLYDMPAHSAVLLALEPAPKGSKVSQTISADQKVQLLPAFSSIKNLTVYSYE